MSIMGFFKRNTVSGDMRSALTTAIDKVKSYRKANKALTLENKTLKADSAAWADYADYWKQRALLAEKRAFALQNKYESVKVEFVPATSPNFEAIVVASNQPTWGIIPDFMGSTMFAPIVPTRGNGHKASATLVKTDSPALIVDTNPILQDVSVKLGRALSESETKGCNDKLLAWGDNAKFDRIDSLVKLINKGKIA